MVEDGVSGEGRDSSGDVVFADESHDSDHGLLAQERQLYVRQPEHREENEALGTNAYLGLTNRPLLSSLVRFFLSVAASTLEKSIGGNTIPGKSPPFM